MSLAFFFRGYLDYWEYVMWDNEQIWEIAEQSLFVIAAI